MVVDLNTKAVPGKQRAKKRMKRFKEKTRGREVLLGMLPKDAIGMEIGVWKGDFSKRLLDESLPKKLHLVDPWKLNSSSDYAVAWYGSGKSDQDKMDGIHNSVLARFQKEIDSQRVVVHRGASTEVLEKFPADSLDFVYIDGDHTYGAVVADLAMAFRVVKPGGLICGDDYDLGRWWQDGVVRALHEFVASHPVVFRLLLDGQFVVCKQEAQAA